MFQPPRLPDWPERLEREIARHRTCAFAWGSFDCATLFSDVARAVAGCSPFDGIDPWPSERAALRALARAGAATVHDYIAARLPAAPVLHLRRGDVGYTAARHPLCCPAIVTGSEAVSRDSTGWIVVPLTHLVCGYRVGI